MRVLVATAMYPTPADPAFGSFVKTQVDALKEAGVEIDLLVLDGAIRKLIYPKGVIQIRRRLARNPADLVHAHYSYVGMVARTQRSAPVVVTYHGSDLLGMVANAKGGHTLSSKLAVAAGRRLARLADACIVQTKEMRGKLRPRDNVHVVPCETDFAVFRPVDREHARHLLGLDPHKKYLLFAAHPKRLVKHFALARETADRMQRRDPGVELVVVHKETQDRLALYMNACDALVFTSFQEGSPNIVKQAMACNLPIVSTGVGDVREVIGGTKWCFIVPADAGSFAEQLGNILRERPRTKGRERIGRFDRSNITRRLIEVYEDAIERFRSRRNGSRHRTAAMNTQRGGVSHEC